MRAGNKSGQLSMLLSLGDMGRQLEDFSAAQKHYRSAEKLARALRDPQTQTDAVTGQALCLRGMGKYQAAIKLLKRTLSYYSSNKDQAGVAYTRWAIGSTSRFAGLLAQAEKNLRRSVALYSKQDDPIGLAYARCGLGGTLRMREAYVESGRLYKAANQTFRRMRDQFGTAYSYCGQSNALRMQGRVHEALSFMNKAGTLYRKLKQKGPLGFVLWSRAQAELALGHLNETEKLLSEARRLFHSAHDPRGILYCDLGDAELLRIKKNPKNVALFRRCFKNAGRLGLKLEESHAKSRLKPAKLYKPFP